MADAAFTPTVFLNETLESASSGLIPAVIGATGAGLGMLALTPFLAPASIPMSLAGMILAVRSRNPVALVLGALGIVWALTALLRSDTFWTVFATVAGSLQPI